MSTAEIRLQSWANSQTEEDAMNDGHAHIWRRMIAQSGLERLDSAKVLDFGCNQGGFLRMLYKMRPFGEGFGVDIAESSLAIANENVPAGAPISYAHVDALAGKDHYFDLAFSHEVIYLLPDLGTHARQIRGALKPGGAYFAAVGCYVENPLWAQWKPYITSYSNVPVPDYSINDYADAFRAEGFTIEARQLKVEDFLAFTSDDVGYFPTILDKLNYHNNHKILFKFTA